MTYPPTTHRNLILESEHLPRSVDLAGQPLAGTVPVIVATRYCVLPIEETAPLSLDRKTQLHRWLASREQLFREYTLSSMLDQHLVPTWLLLVDERLAGEVIDTIEADLPDWASIVPVPAGRSPAVVLEDTINTFRSQAMTHVVARVDNDDAVAADYTHGLSTWTRLAYPTDGRFFIGPLLSYPIGLTHDSRTGRTSLAYTTTGHFSALVIPPGGRINTALSYSHSEVYRGGLDVPVRQLITTQPMWVEILHGDNLANHERPGPQIVMEADYWRDRFGVI